MKRRGTKQAKRVATKAKKKRAPTKAKPATAKAKPKAKPKTKRAAKPKTKRAAKSNTRRIAKPKTRRVARRPQPKQPAPRIAPRKRATKPALPTAPIAPEWLRTLRAAVEATGPDFGAHLAGLGLFGWEHADSPELIGLELWGTELASRDRRAAIGALVRVAQHGLPIVLDRGGIGLDEMGFRATDQVGEGAPVETQLAVAAAWVDSPDGAHFEAVRAATELHRQQQIWSEDLLPNDDRAHWWYRDVGQCCCLAITRSGGSADGDTYYAWSPEVCVGRGLVVAARGLRSGKARIRGILAELRSVLLA